MKYLELLNKNILYLYIDLYNFSNKSELEYSTLFEIKDTIKNNNLYFIDIFKESIYENYKEHISNENINILPIINKLLIKNYDLLKIYNKLKKKNKIIIWNYLKIFIILYEKYYFTL